MIPIDGSIPIGGIKPTEPTKASSSIEPPRQLTLDESPATNTPDASQILKSVTTLTSETGRKLLGEAIRQGTRNPE